MRADMLFVSEIFGPTFQGEGRSLGMPCMFLRLAGCNLACTWCDTPYTWDWKRYDKAREVHRLPLEAVWEQLAASPVRNLVVSGGEPLLQQQALSPLLERLHGEGWRVEVETAGTVAPRLGPWVQQYNVSPKLASSGNTRERRYVPEALQALRDSGRAVWKFVVCREEDVAEVEALVEELRLAPVYLMPEGTDEATLRERLTWLAPLAAARGWHITPRLHVLLYGGRRGI